MEPQFGAESVGSMIDEYPSLPLARTVGYASETHFLDTFCRFCEYHSYAYVYQVIPDATFGGLDKN